MEMHQVRYFLAVAEHLNFTRAAEKMNVAQPSLTRAILKLEEELGGPLFNRERNNTHLTELGRIMLPHLKAAYEAAESARTEAAGFKRREIGQLIIGLETAIAQMQVAQLLADLAVEIPGLEIVITDGDANSLLQSMTEGNIECAIMECPTTPPDRMNATVLYEEPWVVGFRKDHPFAERKNGIELSDLSEMDIIVPANSATIDALFDAHAVHPNRMHQAGNRRWMASLIDSGLGCALLPREEAIEMGIEHRPVIEPTLYRRVVFATMAGRRHSPALQTLSASLTRVDWPSREGKIAAD